MRRAVPALSAVALTLGGCASGGVEPELVPGPRIAPVQGVALTSYVPDGYARAAPELRRLKALGATDVQLVPRWMMVSRRSSAIAPTVESPTVEDVAAGARIARSLGLRVMIKPHVDVADGTFRAEIRPEDRDAWWRSYRSYVLAFADVATAVDAEAFCVGTELTSMAGDTARWRRLIADVRRRAPGMAITFAANWDAMERGTFWDAVDAIGVDAYFPLAAGDDGPDPAAWPKLRRTLARIARTWQRPLLFTEIGYPSEVGAAARPFEERGTEPAPDLQADLYRLVFDAFDDVPWFSGAYWWDWRADGSEGAATGYEPRGKPAEDVLRTRWRRARGDGSRPTASR